MPHQSWLIPTCFFSHILYEDNSLQTSHTKRSKTTKAEIFILFLEDINVYENATELSANDYEQNDGE